MKAQTVKDYIITNDKLSHILEELGCHSVKPHDSARYYSCGYPDGDNKSAITVYSDMLNVVSYTRNIEDKFGNSDIISLVCFIKDMYFTNAIKWLCDALGLDMYNEEIEELPMSLQITQLIKDMASGDDSEERGVLKPISETILSYYYPYSNDIFRNDGVSYQTQHEFEIGYDSTSSRFTIPIRDELGTLIGVKGRRSIHCMSDEKYIYLEPCLKSKILYGLYKTIDYIKDANSVIVVESEKSALVLYSHGYKNVVAIGGHILSKTQVEKLTRLGVEEIILAYDQDVNRLDNGKVDRKEYLKEAKKFISQIKVTAIVDINGDILQEKESPCDRMNVFEKLHKERKVLQNGRE